MTLSKTLQRNTRKDKKMEQHNQELGKTEKVQQQEPKPAHPTYELRPRGCVCSPFATARECFARRYHRDLVFGAAHELDEVCECPCHDREVSDDRL